MACTQQSALKYIRNSTTHLIGRLRNLPLIVEKLHQCRVLNEYEVSDINSIPEECKQTRRILEMVIAEGEEACYEFLKILDVTRKRTLPEQQQDFSASQNGSSCDLHQWITSFPFREDRKVCTTGSGPCHKYQRELKEKAEQVVKYEWLKQTMTITKDESKWKTLPYTPLVLDTDVNKISKIKNNKYRKPRPKKLKTFIPKDKSSLSPVDLLKTNEKKILLVGKPGIGKTTIAQQILSIWAEKEGCDLDYMFYFDDSNFSNISKPISLKSLLCMYCEPPEAKDEVLQDIEKNSEDVVIIFDGIRDLGETSVLHQVLNNNLLRNAKIIVTCRPEDVSEGLLSYWPTYKVEVLGFSGESICAYFNNIFSTDTDTAWSVLKNLELFTLCHVPMYAFIVAVCLSFGPCSIQDLPSTITAVYLHIFRLCIQKHGKKSVKKLDKYIQNNRRDILCLAETSYKALLQKTVCLNGVDCQEHSVQCAFLRSVVIQKSPSSAQTISSFLHNTMQEFWAALWLLENPEKISEILLRCKTEEGKYLRYILPFLCGFLFEQNSELVRCVVPEDQVKTLSEKLPVDIMNTFLLLGPAYEHENARLEFETENLLFVCQCLYESRSEKACSHFLKEVGYHFDLREENLDPHQCCAVSYLINQAEDRSVQLDLENSTVTDPGWKLILSCVKKVQMLGLNPSMFSELWETALHCGQQCDFADVLRVCGSEIHFPVQEDGGLCETAGYVMKQSPEKVKLCLHWDKHIDRPAKNFTETISQCLSNIATIRFIPPNYQMGLSEEWKTRVSSFKMDLCLQGVFYEKETGQKITGTLMSALSLDTAVQQSEFLLDLYSHVKNYETQTGRSVLSALQTLYQSAPAEWVIDLSKRKASLFLEVLKLQTVKKPVNLMDWTDEESEVRIFLECLPYISELGFHEMTVIKEIQILMDLLSHFQSFAIGGDLDLGKLLQHSNFLLDLYSRVKDYETQTGSSVLSALQTLYQSAPAEWFIDLSKRKASLFLEVLKLQRVKKPVNLMGWTDEESEGRIFLECLPYISQLRCDYLWNSGVEKAAHCVQELWFQAVVHEAETGQTTVTLLSSVYSFENYLDYRKICITHSTALLDLYSRVKDYETQTGRSVLLALQTLYQSAPAEWVIDLSKRKASLFLEVLKLQTVKRPVKLMGWTDEESEVRIFLECLPYISQLRFMPPKHQMGLSEEWKTRVSSFKMDLCLQGVFYEKETGQKITGTLMSALSLDTAEQQSEFLLDLYSHVKEYETQTGRSVLSALQTLYQSAPAEWDIDLSKRKASLFLEVLKLQTVKKPVKLMGWTDEEGEGRIFLECLPYISQLSCDCLWVSDVEKAAHCVQELCFQAVVHEAETGQRTVTLLSSVYSFKDAFYYRTSERHSTALLDLYSRVKDYETQTGRSVLSALQTLYQSAPAEWVIDLSKRKASLFLEVLKLQRVKKPVNLMNWTDEESEGRIFLECLPYISELSCDCLWVSDVEKAAHCVQELCFQAVVHEAETGQRTVTLLSSVYSFKDAFYYRTPERHSTVLLDLYSRVKDYETQTGRSVLSALQTLYQSAPAEWDIDLSKRKASLFLEVLKLQRVKKPVNLMNWTDEESEGRIFLECLPYISELSCDCLWDSDDEKAAHCEQELWFQAVVHEAETGQKTVTLLSSVYSFENHLDDLETCIIYNTALLDLYPRVKDYETQTGRSVLSALQTLYQSAPAEWVIDLSKRKASLFLEVLKLQRVKKPVNLMNWTDEESEGRIFLECLPYISELSCDCLWDSDVEKAAHCEQELWFQAVVHEAETGQRTVTLLSSVYSFKDAFYYGAPERHSTVLLDLYSRVKDYETQTGRSVLSALQTLYQSVDAEWVIDLSQRKASLFLEVLKLQRVTKPVNLMGWTDAESEGRIFLECLPYISQLSCDYLCDSDVEKAAHCVQELWFQAVVHEAETGQRTVTLLSSVYRFKDAFYSRTPERLSTALLDLYSRVKDYETQTGRSVLSALQTLYQSAPAEWVIDLSKRKASLFLKVLKLQTVKKPVNLMGWTDEESEGRIFLECLPYISQLSCDHLWNSAVEKAAHCVQELCFQAVVHEAETGQTTVTLLSSVYSFENNLDYRKICITHSTALLDLYSRVKDYETQTGRSVLSALQTLYQSAPAEWFIDLSKRKASLFLEVLKLQTVKKPVKLKGWTDEESEVRIFLECLPYISKLSCDHLWNSDVEKAAHCEQEVWFQAVVHEAETGQRTVTLLSSVYRFKDAFYSRTPERLSTALLDLYSRVKDYETQTGRSVLSALQTLYQSAPAEWVIDLSKRKASLFLKVLKLQTVKKPVNLMGWTDEESEGRIFLECLPYISQLSCDHLWNSAVEKAAHCVQELCFQAVVHEAETGQTTVTLLSSVYSFENNLDYRKICITHSTALLDLYSRVKDYETQTGRSVLSALQTLYQSAPAEWVIDLSERKASLFLEVLKLQTVKKPVKLMGWTDEEGEVRIFLECLPCISQLSCDYLWDSDDEKAAHCVQELCFQAVVHEAETGQRTATLLSSVYSFENHLDDLETYIIHSTALLDLYSRVKDYETQTGRSVLSALQTLYQSAPAEWVIDLSKRKASLFLKVLKLQTVKKPVNLMGWTDEESEGRIFLECLPYISQLSCDYLWNSAVEKAAHCVQELCFQAVVHEAETGQTTVTLLSSVYRFTDEVYVGTSERHSTALLDLYSRVKDYETQTGRSVLSALQTLYQSAPAEWVIDLSKRKASLFLKVLKLQTVKKPVNLMGWTDEESEGRIFLECLPYISQLRLDRSMTLRLARVLRAVRGQGPVMLEELSLDLSDTKPLATARTLNSLTSLLRLWKVQCVDLSKCHIQGQAVIPLLSDQGPLTIRLHTETVQQLAVMVCEVGEEELTLCFLEKVGRDLTGCTLDWNVLHYLLKHSKHPISVDLKKSGIKEQNIRDLLPFLHRIQLKRVSSRLIMAVLREVFEIRAGHLVSSLVKSAGNWIILNSRVLDSKDCAALRFTLSHADCVGLSLIWASVTEEEIQRTVPLLTRVSKLRVDRKLLLKLLHSCVTSEHQQGAAELLQTLQFKLDFSCSRSVDLTAVEEGMSLCLSVSDCRAISMAIQQARCDTQLVLEDCTVDDAGLEELYPILHRVHLRVNKPLLLQLVCKTPVQDEGRSVSRAAALLRALGGELDLSHTPLSLQACRSLALVLDRSDGLAELDLSHCQLTDHCVKPLLPNLHKARVLDLSHNDITNHGGRKIHEVVSDCSFIESVRLFGNKISDRGIFQEDRRYEIW